MLQSTKVEVMMMKLREKNGTCKSLVLLKKTRQQVMNEDYSRSPSIHKYTPVIGWIIKNGNSCLTGGSGECVSERMNE